MTVLQRRRVGCWSNGVLVLGYAAFAAAACSTRPANSAVAGAGSGEDSMVPAAPDCETRPPSPGYVRVEIGTLDLQVPPEYRLVEDIPHSSGYRVWMAPDSSLLLAAEATEHESLLWGFDEEDSEIMTEGTCKLGVAGVTLVFHRMGFIRRATGDTVFAALSEVNPAQPAPILVLVAGRTRSERTRLLGVLAAASRR